MAGEPSPLTPDEAIAWHRKRIAMSAEEFKALQVQARKQAFTVSGIVQESLIADVQAALGAALTEGTAIDDFKAAVGAQLETNWAGSVANPAARIETIFRTNTQSSYNAGRHKQANDPDMLELRPFWRFVAILDDRTSPVCRAAHGTLLPADDPWWQTHFPPLHFNCRCSFETLTPRQAGRLGLTEKPSAIKGGEGFGGQPTHDSLPEGTTMAAFDRFGYSGLPSLLTEPEHAYGITPADGADLPYVTRYLSAAVGGVITVVTKGGETTPIPVAAGVQTKVRAVRVLATGTTATGIVGFD